MGRVVLVTGISRDIGRRFARAAAGDPSIDRVIGVDVIPPRGDIGDVSFVRADIRNPVIAKVLAKEDVDTVVHMSVIATPGSAGGRGTMKELNVIGSMQLLAACQKSTTVDRLVVKSTTTVYGSSPRDPALLLNLALCYLKTGQTALARRDLELLLEVNPTHARAWGYLGLACERLGALGDAQRAFEQGGHGQMARRMAERRLSQAPPAAFAEDAGSARQARDVVAAAFEELDAGDRNGPDPDTFVRP